MKKLGIIISAITVAIIGFGVYFSTKPKEPIKTLENDRTKLTYFWGNGCPHCAVVNDFFDSWDKKDQVEVQKYEVWYDKANQALMSKEAAEICNLSQNELAVPLLITPEEECLMGDTPIIEYYKNLNL